MPTTCGHLLGGLVRYAQPQHGYRTGIEPVLLAAAVPARPGERVLEAGTGAGAALLCLAARVVGLTGMGVEREAGLAALARQNIAANGWTDRLSVLAGEVGDLGDVAAPGAFDHALANPPWHDPAATASPVAARAAAKRASPGLLAHWAEALARRLRRRGSLTLILPAAALAEGVTALAAAQCGAVTLLPLWPHEGEPARLLLLRGLKSAGDACRMLPGLVLHRPQGGYTEAAEAVLRDGRPLC